MVAISAAVLSKGGKVLLARQFIPISRQRMEGYLASFPKLIPVDHQHTIIDTESIRYLYQPLEALYLVLITNKHSNIMEDIDTLRTLAKLIPEYCLGVTEEAVSAHVFDLIFAFDEVIGSNGYKEAVTIAQVKTYTEMDSHEEKLQRIILESKMNEAKLEMKRKAENIAKEREDRKKAMAMGGGGGMGGGDGRHGRYASMEGGMGSGGGGGGGMGGGGGYDEDRDRAREAEREREERERARSKAASPSGGPSGPKAKGMQLGKSGAKTDNLLTQLSKEDAMGPPVRRPNAAASSSSAPAAPVAGENVRVVVREKLAVELEKDGTVKRVEVKGEMKLRIMDPDFARIVIHTSTVGDNIERRDYKCSLHPKINKKLWADAQALSLTDAAKGFPVGGDKELVIIKWRKLGDESDLPFTINFWPSAEGSSTAVNVEYANVSGRRLTDVSVRIPIPGGEPEVSQVAGDYKYDPRAKALTWRIADASAEHSSGQLEFTAQSTDTDAFYPIQVDFVSDDTLSGLAVSKVVGVDDEKAVEFIGDHKLEVEKYTIE